MKTLDNHRQAVESPKSWNLMGYFCAKNTSLQLKYYVQRIYLTLLSNTYVKIHEITYVIFETVSHFSRHRSSVFFFSSKHYILLTKVAHQSIKITKFFMSFFKQKLSFSSRLDYFWIFWISIIRDNSSVLY